MRLLRPSQLAETGDALVAAVERYSWRRWGWTT
jgi:hypothetical protein